MTIYERLICLSEWVCFVVFDRERMTLSAKAQECARLRGNKSCIYSQTIDLLFWYDPNHCRKAYAYYRHLCRNNNRKYNGTE